MRHEKISLADHIRLPAALTGREAEGGSEAKEKDDKGPPVAIKHFYYCGRSPSRSHARSDSAGIGNPEPKAGH